MHIQIYRIMRFQVDPCLTHSDTIVLKNLIGDVEGPSKDYLNDEKTITLLSILNDPGSEAFESTVFATWDLKDAPTNIGSAKLDPAEAQSSKSLFFDLQTTLLKSYINWASTVVRRPTDVVFLTHILIYISTSVPSALYLYYSFSYTHAIFHWIMTAWYCGAFTLLLHNHIHNNGVLSKSYFWFDKLFPYILEPLMGHSWDSYYYHHVKHHHVEANGPDDLSSTIRYQRDSIRDFSLYVGRFLFFIWLDLPLYFLRKSKTALAIRSAVSEYSSYAFIYLLATYNFRPTLFVLIIPLIQMRIGMMIGNFGQHAFVDEIEPDSDFRSSITLIDVPVSSSSFSPIHTIHSLTSSARVTDIASTTAGTHRTTSTLAVIGATIRSHS
jgi:hypothetical protein